MYRIHPVPLDIVPVILTTSEFFPDETFVDDKVMDMSLKRIKRGINPHADRLLDWILHGCGDALRNKYLESVSLGIFTDVEKPEAVVETYTLNFSYPTSPDHEMVRNVRQGSLSLTMKTAKGKETAILPPENEGFGQQIVRILRTLCIMIQTLKCLPSKKYASMQMTYYDELTPTSYEPPGFAPGVFNVNYLFAGKTFKHDFGFITSSFHRYSECTVGSRNL